ncbi:GNAT family N-acetyltransferase [Phyllobacterium sp. 628]|uniref:GNAT family N-acetyltransferase n=1 Tax=Phyllobacterium sp. 628 TaxID=2718938 RepID=UPI001662429C|nr:GNAT family N-acetyltransferase [Phyllobacterium sp. 628]QND50852.1 GNAT family N-acetyltransferase [Phyllobacterium sp. 628]
MKIRTAIAGDSDQICNVLRRSIEELCVSDHGASTAIIADWLANKTPENVLVWINMPNQRMLVAVDGSHILGVGSVTASGEIILNYVSPDARFLGISKAILTGLEAYLKEQGKTRSNLTSTLTAHRFYEACGYRDSGPIEMWGPLAGQPMEKQLP